jgi:5-methyltetrahydropteroyltriglutamate--homocysteine methyltransferase
MRTRGAQKARGKGPPRSGDATGRMAARGPVGLFGRTSSQHAVLLTAVVGSYPQPEWLVDRTALGSRLPPRTRAPDLWRIAPEFLEQAQDDATLLAIRDMERAGIDVITDGEIRRESYSNRFATALEGMDLVNPGTALDRTGHPNPVPRVVGPIRRSRPVLVRDVRFLRANTDRLIKATVPGPFTMSQQAQDDYYGDEEALAMSLAAAVNEEVRDLFTAGADVVQLDEPYLQARAEKARRFAIAAINRALEGAEGVTALHTCFGYAHIVHERPNGYPFFLELADAAVDQISLEAAQQNVDLSILRALPDKHFHVGVIDLADDSPVEDVDVVVQRIRNALDFVQPERLILAPDCGMKYLPRWKAFQKLRVLADAAAKVRREL